jgi:hypothetical protein
MRIAVVERSAPSVREVVDRTAARMDTAISTLERGTDNWRLPSRSLLISSVPEFDGFKSRIPVVSDETGVACFTHP